MPTDPTRDADEVNWRAFCKEVWWVGPQLLVNVPDELRSLLGLLRDGSIELDTQPWADAFDEWWPENPERAAEVALQMWLEGVQDKLDQFCGFEVNDPGKVRRRIERMKLKIEDDAVASLVRAAKAPHQE